jgi:hypothetical protein
MKIAHDDRFALQRMLPVSNRVDLIRLAGDESSLSCEAYPLVQRIRLA